MIKIGEVQSFEHLLFLVDNNQITFSARLLHDSGYLNLISGSAADSAVAAMFCLGVVNIHSSGIGGGGFLVLYKREEKKFYLYDYRDQAPMKAKPELFLNKSDASRYG